MEQKYAPVADLTQDKNVAFLLDMKCKYYSCAEGF